MIKGKALAFSLLRVEFEGLFGVGLTPEQYKYIMAAYTAGIKKGIEDGKVVRLTWLGSFQPCGLRIALKSSPKRKEKVAGYNNNAYICGVNGEQSNSLFKPKYYVSPSKSTATESKGFKPRELGIGAKGKIDP